MTICAVWRENNEIKFAADSRISLGGKFNNFDYACKISPIRLAVNQVNPITLSDDKYFDGDVGLCFAGSVVNSFALKDTLINVLTGWTIIDHRKELDIEYFAKEVFKYYQSISKELCSSLMGPQGTSVVSFSGYCFERKRYEAYLFEPNIENGSYSFKRIVENEGEFIFFGSGKNKALKIFEDKHSHFNEEVAISIIQEMIKKELDPSVGGTVTIGSFNKKKSFNTTYRYYC